MNDALATSSLIPGLPRIPTSVAHALFSADDWVSHNDPAIVTALAAASPNTRIAWRQDWIVFRHWATERAKHWMPDERDRIRLPVLPELLMHFVNDMVSGDGQPAPRALATVRRYLSTLGTLHMLLDCPDPTKSAIVRNTVRARARRSGGQHQAAAIRWNQIVAAIRILPDDLGGLRDKTLLAVAHNTLARRSELVALNIEDVEFLPDGVGIVALRPTKSNLEAEVDPRYLAPPTTALVRAWIERSGLREGPLFVALTNRGCARRTNGLRGAARTLLASGRRLTDKEVNIILKLAMGRLAVATGECVLPEGPPHIQRRALLEFARPYSGHSTRIGAAQDMAADGVSTAAMLQAGGWSDERMVKRYLRKLGALEGGMAQLFRSEPARSA